LSLTANLDCAPPHPPWRGALLLGNMARPRRRLSDLTSGLTDPRRWSTTPCGRARRWLPDTRLDTESCVSPVSGAAQWRALLLLGLDRSPDVTGFDRRRKKNPHRHMNRICDSACGCARWTRGRSRYASRARQEVALRRSPNARACRAECGYGVAYQALRALLMLISTGIRVSQFAWCWI
jgi:hypothetical protein